MVYQGAGGSAGYDADGDVVAYQYRDGSGRIDQYAVTYLRKDGYLQSTTSGQNVSDTPNVRPSTELRDAPPDMRGDSRSETKEVLPSYVQMTFGFTPVQIAQLRNEPHDWVLLERRLRVTLD